LHKVNLSLNTDNRKQVGKFAPGPKTLEIIIKLLF